MLHHKLIKAYKEEFQLLIHFLDCFLYLKV